MVWLQLCLMALPQVSASHTHWRPLRESNYPHFLLSLCTSCVSLLGALWPMWLQILRSSPSSIISYKKASLTPPPRLMPSLTSPSEYAAWVQAYIYLYNPAKEWSIYNFTDLLLLLKSLSSTVHHNAGNEVEACNFSFGVTFHSGYMDL